MTRDKAIDLLDNLVGMVEDNNESDYDTALKMGIDALKLIVIQEQLNDVLMEKINICQKMIDRQGDVIEKLMALVKKYSEGSDES